MNKNQKTKRIIANLSQIILYEMGKEDITSKEMSKKCGVSKRKLDEIIYKEDKGLMLEVFINICDGIKVKYEEVFK